MNQDQLAKTLAAHALWLAGNPAGVMADLRWADLSLSNLSLADLRGADLSLSDLRGADLRWADLRWANLCGAKLTGAKLSTHTIGEGRVATFALLYWAMTTRDDKGVRRLQYGCETLTLDGWEMLAGDLASAHHPHEADIYERETRALVALCRTMDEVKQ
jgi:hypothetical protein